MLSVLRWEGAVIHGVVSRSPRSKAEGGNKLLYSLYILYIIIKPVILNQFLFLIFS